MNKKIQISERVLRQMIVRVINETILEKSGINQNEAIKNWALAVMRGADATHCSEFGPFYESIFSDYRSLAAIKIGVTQEVAFQSKYSPNSSGQDTQNSLNSQDTEDTDDILGSEEIPDIEDNETPQDTNNNDNEVVSIERKPLIMVDKLFKGSGVGQDILQDFFSGVDCIVKDTSKPDSFKGDNVVNCVNVFDRKGPREFLTYLFRLLTIYARHYCRKHYNEWAMQYGIGVTKIGSDKNTHIEDQYTGQKDDTTETPMEYETSSLNSHDENKYFSKMRALAEKIIDDPRIGLGPQEKVILQCMIDLTKTPINPERLERMQSLSPTQQRQELYQEISERTNIDLPNVKRSISSAINKAKQSKYAKQLAEKKHQREKMINEVTKIVMNEILML